MREFCEIELDDNGDVIRTFGSVQDISEQVDLENRLRQARKMEAVGQLTSGIAHDFNNLLAVVMGNLDLAIACTKEDSNIREFLSEAMQGAQKGADLNKQLLTFSRQQVVEERVLNVNDIIHNMSSLLARTLGEEIEIETVYCKEDCLGMLDQALLESAILNLAINARDAMAGVGQLRIETGISRRNTSGNTDDIDRDMIRISISDSGSGMTQAVKEHAIEPFYTTKEVGAGSGLGLSMVYGFVTQSDGRLEIESEVGKGTTIHIMLPFAGSRAKALDTPNTDEIAMAIDGEVILVVEDQPQVRDVVVRQLASLGYAVLEAEDGRVAIKILESCKSIDLILSDMVMPGGLGGEDVASKAKAILPDAKVLFMSGNPVRSSGAGSKIQIPLLQKPFRKADLARAVRHCLDGK